MSNKHEGSVPAGGFQLDPKDPKFDTHNMIANGVVQAAIKWLNKADLTGDGVADLPQFAPYFFKALPHIMQLASLIDWKKVFDWVMSQGFFKDHHLASSAVEKINTEVDAASKVIST